MVCIIKSCPCTNNACRYYFLSAILPVANFSRRVISKRTLIRDTANIIAKIHSRYVTVGLIRPDHMMRNRNAANYRKLATHEMYIFTFPKKYPGIWTYSLINQPIISIKIATVLMENVNSEANKLINKAIKMYIQYPSILHMVMLIFMMTLQSLI